MDQSTQKTKPGLRDYWQIFLRRKWIIMLPIVGIISIAVPGSFLLTPEYQATTTLISREVERGSILRGVADIPVPRGEAMNTMRYKIESRTFMKDIADKLDIAGYLQSVGKPSDTDNVVSYLRKIIKLRARGSNIFEITVIHPRPDMAKNIADTIALTYKEVTQRWRQDATSASTNFINNELEVYRRQLREAEEAILAAQQKGVLNSPGAESNSLISELGKLRANLVEADLDLREANGELENARELKSSDATEGGSLAIYMDPEVAQLEAKLAGIKTQYAELSMRYTDQYPEVRRLKGEIFRTQETLDQAKARFSNNQRDIASRVQFWEDRVRSLKLKQTALNDKISEYDRKLQQLPQRELELARLMREKSAAENIYSMLLSRLNESELLRSSESQNISPIPEVLDPAILPEEPAKPNKKKIAILALAMGMILGGGSAFLLEYFDRSFRSVDEVINYLGIPVLSAIPKLTTHDFEPMSRKYKIIQIAGIILVCVLVLTVAADIVSVAFLSGDSIFLRIARVMFSFLKRI